MNRQPSVETCTSCGSAMLVLRGRTENGTPVREIVCKKCQAVWTPKRSIFSARIRP
jgi:hypothetical protein